MLNIYIFIIILINISIITIIFWLITLIELYFNKNTQHETKSVVYECGFLTINKNIFPVTLNLIILLFFVILYEVEFILILPIFLSINTFSNIQIILSSIIFLIIITTLYMDIWLKKINWIY